MKKFWLIIVVLLLVLGSGCEEKEPMTPTVQMKAVEPVGQVFEPFHKIIEGNIFDNVTAFEGRLLKSETYKDPDSEAIMHNIQMLDVYANTLANYTCSSETGYSVTTLTATEDGGFLFTLGFWDHSYPDNTWASERGFASHIIKCDSSGNLQFDLALDSVGGSALRCCIEKNECFYFFGEIETPETKTRGVHSPTDIYMTVLDRNASVLNSRCIGGTDFDDLNAVEATENGFLLSVTAQSDDGDFASSGSGGYRVDWVVAVNDGFEITSKEKETGRSYFDEVIGVKDGTPVYQSDEIFKEFDAGSPTALIDYGDYYLIVSSNITGEYEHTPPFISMTWHYFETVYSAYEDSGKMIFRAAVDSSPDYDAMVEALNTPPATAPTKPEHSDLHMPTHIG